MQWALLIPLLKASVAFALSEIDPATYPGVVKVLTLLQNLLSNVAAPPNVLQAEAIPHSHLGKVGPSLPAQPFTVESIRAYAEAA